MAPSETSLVTWLFQPFDKIAGWKALTLGLLSQILAVVLAARMGARYDGVLDFHLSSSAGFTRVLIDQGINLAVLWLVFGTLLGLQAKGRFRWIDLFGLVAFSRWPLLLMPLSLAGGFFNRLAGYFIQTGKPAAEIPATADIFWLLVFSVLILLCTIWSLTLLYRAYRTLLHKPGAWPVVWFITALVFAEILSKYLLYSTS